MKRVLFVCMGNICRSPLGEAILRHQASASEHPVSVDSAGTSDWHVGQPSDARAIEVAESRGYAMTHRARQVRPIDFQIFDLIVAMDTENVRALKQVPGFIVEKVRLARSFDPDADGAEVEDPYYGTLDEFKTIADQLEAACRGILAHVARTGEA
ncbi:MAG: low molecular weight protein-tyrosine-phosphatase [Fimbriimonadaceae bacterium]